MNLEQKKKTLIKLTYKYLKQLASFHRHKWYITTFIIAADVVTVEKTIHTNKRLIPKAKVIGVYFRKYHHTKLQCIRYREVCRSVHFISISFGSQKKVFIDFLINHERSPKEKFYLLSDRICAVHLSFYSMRNVTLR